MNRFYAVEAVRKRSKRSWVNYKNAALKELGLPYHFGTPKVESCSTSYLKTAMSESGLSAADILYEIESRDLA
jgi:hypothetical protein